MKSKKKSGASFQRGAADPNLADDPAVSKQKSCLLTRFEGQRAYARLFGPTPLILFTGPRWPSLQELFRSAVGRHSPSLCVLR